MIKWTEKLLDKCVSLLINGYNYKAISEELNLSYQAVDSKLRKSRYKYSEINPGVPYNHSSNKIKKSKYEDINWSEIQKDYDVNLISYYEIIKKYQISERAILWASKNNRLKFRSKSDSAKIAWKIGKGMKSKKEGFERYQQLCEFKFNLKDYPTEFDFNLIKKHGWYKAKNKGNNLCGVSRDHMISIKFGFENNISPKIISHPANCKLLVHTDNQKKRTKCSIKIGDLLNRIQEWDKKYAAVVEPGLGINLQN